MDLPTKTCASVALLGQVLVGLSGTCRFSQALANPSYVVVHNFHGLQDGCGPGGRLVLIGSELYGVTRDCGKRSGGTLYKFNLLTKQIENLVDFPGVNSPNRQTRIGCNPGGGLTFDGTGALFGALAYCGPYSYQGRFVGAGAVYTFKLPSSAFQVLHGFSNSDGGYYPGPELISDGNGALYGVTTNGQYTGAVVFSLAGIGKGFRRLHIFKDVTTPYGALTFGGDGALYGTTLYSGDTTNCIGGCGLIFRIDPVTGAYRILHIFKGDVDGQNPHGGLISDGGGHLYGVTVGTQNAGGTIFRITDHAGSPSEAQFAVMYTFTGNGDGRNASTEMTFDATTSSFYGVANRSFNTGQPYNSGSIFRFNPATKTLTTIYSLTELAGAFESPLLSDGKGGYIGSSSGGSTGNGQIFRFRP